MQCDDESLERLLMPCVRLLDLADYALPGENRRFAWRMRQILGCCLPIWMKIRVNDADAVDRYA